jgi:hypothetical protein
LNSKRQNSLAKERMKVMERGELRELVPPDGIHSPRGGWGRRADPQGRFATVWVEGREVASP